MKLFNIIKEEKVTGKNLTIDNVHEIWFKYLELSECFCTEHNEKNYGIFNRNTCFPPMDLQDIETIMDIEIHQQ